MEQQIHLINTNEQKKLKLISVIGTTGAGKSKLAIDLAKKFDGEVISADSMQIYKNVDIVTNKVTKEEAQGIPHHLIDFLDTSELEFNARTFVKMSIPTIEEISKRGKVPIIVGGTHYYIEALLWFQHLAEDSPEHPIEEKKNTSGKEEEKKAFGKEEEEEDEYKLLQKIDPIMAAKVHPNNKRKIKHYIETYKQTGKKQSEFIAESKKELRYDACMLWVDCEDKARKQRLKDRIDDMVKRGLLDELKALHEKHKNEEIDFTRGIFQSIGFKEFADYFAGGKTKLEECLESLKNHTSRYAKAQLIWIRQRFLKRGIILHKLDSTDILKSFIYLNNFLLTFKHQSLWETNVQKPAFEIVDAFLRDEKVPSKWQVNPEPDPILDAEWKKYSCEHCNRELNGLLEWKQHLKSKQHRKLTKEKKQKVKDVKSDK